MKSALTANRVSSDLVSKVTSSNISSGKKLGESSLSILSAVIGGGVIVVGDVDGAAVTGATVLTALLLCSLNIELDCYTT
jgi:hypothetical protein